MHNYMDINILVYNHFDGLAKSKIVKHSYIIRSKMSFNYLKLIIISHEYKNRILFINCSEHKIMRKIIAMVSNNNKTCCL